MHTAAFLGLLQQDGDAGVFQILQTDFEILLAKRFAEEGLGFEELDLGAGAGSRADRGHSARAAGETGSEGSARRKARELT